LLAALFLFLFLDSCEQQTLYYLENALGLENDEYIAFLAWLLD
jgi:hypothetical protein